MFNFTRHGITMAYFIDLDMEECVLCECSHKRGHLILGPKQNAMRLNQAQCFWLAQMLMHNATTGALPLPGDPREPDYQI